MFYLTLIQLILGIITVAYDGQITWPTRASLPFLLVIGICGLVAHFCITKALSLTSAAVVAPLDFARLLVVAILAMFLYAEPLDIWVFVGAVVIFGGNYLNIWFETRKVAPKNAT